MSSALTKYCLCNCGLWARLRTRLSTKCLPVAKLWILPILELRTSTLLNTQGYVSPLSFDHCSVNPLLLRNKCFYTRLNMVLCGLILKLSNGSLQKKTRWNTSSDSFSAMAFNWIKMISSTFWEIWLFLQRVGWQDWYNQLQNHNVLFLQLGFSTDKQKRYSVLIGELYRFW